MRHFSFVLFAFLIVGCSSSPKNSDSQSPVTHLTEETTSPGDNDGDVRDSSAVLSKNKKCPKKTKLVNGKCMLQVESDD